MRAMSEYVVPRSIPTCISDGRGPKGSRNELTEFTANLRTRLGEAVARLLRRDQLALRDLERLHLALQSLTLLVAVGGHAADVLSNRGLDLGEHNRELFAQVLRNQRRPRTLDVSQHPPRFGPQ